MRMTASWFRSPRINRIQGRGAISAPDGELPSDLSPAAPRAGQFDHQQSLPVRPGTAKKGRGSERGDGCQLGQTRRLDKHRPIQGLSRHRDHQHPSGDGFQPRGHGPLRGGVATGRPAGMRRSMERPGGLSPPGLCCSQSIVRGGRHHLEPLCRGGHCHASARGDRPERGRRACRRDSTRSSWGPRTCWRCSGQRRRPG